MSQGVSQAFKDVVRCSCVRFVSDQMSHTPSVCAVHPMPTLHWLTRDDCRGENRRIWGAWFARHGVDRIYQIAVGMPIIRNVEEHQIVLIEMWEPEGDRVDSGDPNQVTHAFRDSYKDSVYRSRVVQLDREPEPFPYVRPKPQPPLPDAEATS